MREPKYDPQKGAAVGQRGPGRPGKWTPALKRTFVRYLAGSCSRRQACALVAASHTSLHHAIKADPAFKAAIHAAEAAGIAGAAKCFTKGATKDWKAAERYLARRDPSRWGLASEGVLTTSGVTAVNDARVLAEVYAKLGVGPVAAVPEAPALPAGDGPPEASEGEPSP